MKSESSTISIKLTDHEMVPAGCYKIMLARDEPFLDSALRELQNEDFIVKRDRMIDTFFI